jgi:class 3 adenylate cyclase
LPGLIAGLSFAACAQLLARAGVWKSFHELRYLQGKRLKCRTWPTKTTPVALTGDGILATFDGPARGVRCACAIADEIRPLGIEVRAGLHTGECEMMGDDVGGIAVHIGARVASLAGAGEVLVSSMVKDLVAGSGLRFGDRGSQSLKGVPGEWRIYAVER